MTKILVVTNNLDKGLGITEWIRHYYNRLVLYPDIQVNIIVESGRVNIPDKYFDENIKIISFPQMKIHPFRYIYNWVRHLNQIKRYDYVHIHADNLTKFIPLWLLRKQNNVVIHSHNSTNDKVENSRVKSLMNRVGKHIVSNGNFIRFACSDTAARWLFGNMPYVQVNNGVEIDDFKFNPTLRVEYQHELNLDNKYVFAHVGRFSHQKNQVRLIHIFKEIQRLQPNAQLLLIGQGNLEDVVRQMVVSNRLEKNVQFLGYRDDVKGIMNAVDAVVFPSLYEGLPISLIEAQVNGVPVYYSSRITSEVQILPTSTSFNLNDSDAKIAGRILDKLKLKDTNLKERDKASTIVERAGYSDQHTIKQLYAFYTKQRN
ncbi:glycosyltransferase family 1 protein [Lactiplantibacillus plantarum]|uniref:glycosyltransferase n=1 Tax=Lactiplantibacillus plantarum TaxID=1590 RepID=UPI003851D785|nr:glycosyltransferase family 1 protein [Lactiplantibacillus plantarum]